MVALGRVSTCAAPVRFREGMVVCSAFVVVMGVGVGPAGLREAGVGVCGGLRPECGGEIANGVLACWVHWDRFGRARAFDRPFLPGWTMRSISA